MTYDCTLYSRKIIAKEISDLLRDLIDNMRDMGEKFTINNYFLGEFSSLMYLCSKFHIIDSWYVYELVSNANLLCCCERIELFECVFVALNNFNGEVITNVFYKDFSE